ncbi:hypothetical protein HYW55_01270 [Candidatus Gottesmanbacteria bacterium]|nr:hypothetical protein [Candidatus Gottesmanbacteria bacterium]
MLGIVWKKDYDHKEKFHAHYITTFCVEICVGMKKYFNKSFRKIDGYIVERMFLSMTDPSIERRKNSIA